jgi:hypothetical protein
MVDVKQVLLVTDVTLSENVTGESLKIDRNNLDICRREPGSVIRMLKAYVA